MPDIPVNNCCGCTACYNICPVGAIEMHPDKEGFLYPVVTKAQCIDCLKCEQVCPEKNPPALHEAYADVVVVQNSSEDVLSKSTSGGFVDAMYKYVIDEMHGYGVGVHYSDEFLPTHIVTDNYSHAVNFRNSKYAQSELSDVFSQIKALLKADKMVLFVGTPCQVAGLNTFLQKQYDNLITVDLVCRSVPSPKLLREYINWQEKRFHSKVKKLTCRKKTYGYHSGTLEIEFENNRRYSGSNRVDYYMKAFHSDICSRNSCYSCSYKTKHRCSDFTVFDSFSAHKVTTQTLSDNDRGYSNVLVHTQKGKNLLYKLSSLAIYKADADKMFEYTGSMESQSVKRKPQRDTFYLDLDELGFEKTVRKYVSVTLKDRVIEKAKPVVYFAKMRKK